jgi:hypothetical protein
MASAGRPALQTLPEEVNAAGVLVGGVVPLHCQLCSTDRQKQEEHSSWPGDTQIMQKATAYAYTTSRLLKCKFDAVFVQCDCLFLGCSRAELDEHVAHCYQDSPAPWGVIMLRVILTIVGVAGFALELHRASLASATAAPATRASARTAAIRAMVISFICSADHSQKQFVCR